VGADQGPPLRLRQAGRQGEVVDRLGQALGVDGERRGDLRRQLLQQRAVLGVRVGQELLDVNSVRPGHREPP